MPPPPAAEVVLPPTLPPKDVSEPKALLAFAGLGDDCMRCDVDAGAPDEETWLVPVGGMLVLLLPP
jgi:hypothetical protein